MSVVRVLVIRCDGGCDRTIEGVDPRHGVRALRRAARIEGWATAQGSLGGPGRDVCPTCLAGLLKPAEARRAARRIAS